MSKVKFEIGEKERHTVFVHNDLVLKHITIEIDGEKVADESHFSPKGKKFEFDIGDSEKHHLEITCGGFSQTELLVDGNEAQGS
jgi:hypothetical protein